MQALTPRAPAPNYDTERILAPTTRREVPTENDEPTVGKFEATLMIPWETILNDEDDNDVKRHFQNIQEQEVETRPASEEENAFITSARQKVVAIKWSPM